LGKVTSLAGGLKKSDKFNIGKYTYFQNISLWLSIPVEWCRLKIEARLAVARLFFIVVISYDYRKAATIWQVWG
jgi:hypothetical protein